VVARKQQRPDNARHDRLAGDALSRRTLILDLSAPGHMMAVLIRFGHEFLRMIREMNLKLTRIVIVHTLCTGITGIPLYLLFRESFTGCL
jgi:hypothetical protein